MGPPRFTSIVRAVFQSQKFTVVHLGSRNESIRHAKSTCVRSTAAETTLGSFLNRENNSLDCVAPNAAPPVPPHTSAFRAVEYLLTINQPKCLQIPSAPHPYENVMIRVQFLIAND